MPSPVSRSLKKGLRAVRGQLTEHAPLFLRRNLRAVIKQASTVKESSADQHAARLKVLVIGDGEMTYEQTLDVSHGWRCALCAIFGDLPTREMLNVHYTHYHWQVKAQWVRVQVSTINVYISLNSLIVSPKAGWELSLKLPPWDTSPEIDSDVASPSLISLRDRASYGDSMISLLSEDDDSILVASGSPAQTLPRISEIRPFKAPLALRRTANTAAVLEITDSSDDASIIEVTPGLYTHSSILSEQQSTAYSAVPTTHAPAIRSSTSTVDGETASASSKTLASRAASQVTSVLNDDSEISIIATSAPRRGRIEHAVKFERSDSPRVLKSHSPSFVSPDGRQWDKPPPHSIHGPAVRSPILPRTSQDGTRTLSYSCRPGGERLYDLLELLPTDQFGVLEWWILEKEEVRASSTD